MNALVSNVLTQVFITLIAVSGIYVLTGLTGMFSLGQAAFMAIGSYVSGLLVIFRWSRWASARRLPPC